MKVDVSRVLVVILTSLTLGTGLRAANPTPEDVGDADSFGHGAQYMGAASGFVTLAVSCPAPTPSPTNVNDNQCFVLGPAPAAISFDAEDICRIKLPKKATRTIIYPVLTFFQNYQLENTTGVPQPQALFDYQADITIDSDVLLDPSIIDPSTGAPANGHLLFQFGPNRVRDDRSMNVNDRYRNRLTFTRAGNLGITKAFLISSGLSSNVVDDLFKSSMTLHLNIRGTAKLVTDATITGNMRLFGD